MLGPWLLSFQVHGRIKVERDVMQAAEWIGLVTLVVGISGAVVAWMMRISRQLARIENAVDRVPVVEADLKETQIRVTKNSERLSVLEAAG